MEHSEILKDFLTVFTLGIKFLIVPTRSRRFQIFDSRLRISDEIIAYQVARLR